MPDLKSSNTQSHSGKVTVPYGDCPNCDTSIPVDSEECPKCRALFGAGSAWHLEPNGKYGAAADTSIAEARGPGRKEKPSQASDSAVGVAGGIVFLIVVMFALFVLKELTSTCVECSCVYRVTPPTSCSAIGCRCTRRL